MAAVSSLLLRLLFFFFFFFLVDGQCLDDQKKLLLDLRSELIVDSSKALINLLRWNETDDCCQWSGLGCDAGGHVIILYLSHAGITGGISESSSLFRFTYLSEIHLFGNHFTTTHIPNKFHRLPNLTYLDLSHAGFIGPIPSTLSNLTELLYLDLSGNFLTAPIPSLHSCNKLEWIDLNNNNLMGSGSLSHLHFEALTNLSTFIVSHNSLNGTIPHHLFLLPSLVVLDLSHNQFSEPIQEFPTVNISDVPPRLTLDLSSNRIEGPIPNSFFQLHSLSALWLSNNLFSGTFKLEKIQNLPMLTDLGLSDNNLSVEAPASSMNSSLNALYLSSCNLYEFPDLRNQSSLSELDLSNNRIRGDIPSWIWDIGRDLNWYRPLFLNLSLNLLTDFQKPYRLQGSLHLLDLHSNQLRCEFPLLPPSTEISIAYIFLSNNSLTGVVPTSICNIASSLVVLDLSSNNLSGRIPPCLLEKHDVLQVLNLRGNNINGVIPDKFSRECGLKTFDVSDNNLGGKIPKSLANCKELVVMNIGSNNFDDTFPCILPLSLQVLVLHSNRFHGDLTCHQTWPNIQIVDISSNNFTGTLNLLNLSTWRRMMLQYPAHLRPNRSNFEFLGVDYLYRDEVTMTVKGIEVMLVKIWPDFTSIDLSCNNFEGEIPDAVGNLTSLYLLNLSHNALASAIPKSLGALTELGSLDLSANQLTGKIPEELAKLTFLSILNVSHNRLTGKIPSGPQFQTFQADSFVGNTGLCGFPLNKSCSSHTHGSGVMPSKSKDKEVEWEYVFAALGYVVGLGSIVWTLLCCRSLRERYFEKIEEVVDKIFYERARRRRHKRRVERRNEVIRRRRRID